MSQVQKDNLKYWSLAGPIWTMLLGIIAVVAWATRNQATNEQLWKEQMRINTSIETRLVKSEDRISTHELDDIALRQCLISKGIKAIR